MERKNTLLLTVIAIATLLVAVVGATFAYFSASGGQVNDVNVDVSTPSDSGSFSATGTDIELALTSADMSNGINYDTAPDNKYTPGSDATLGKYAKYTANKDITVTLGTSSAGYECYYDINWYWKNGTSVADTSNHLIYVPTQVSSTPLTKEFTIEVSAVNDSGAMSDYAITETNMNLLEDATSTTAQSFNNANLINGTKTVGTDTLDDLQHALILYKDAHIASDKDTSGTQTINQTYIVKVNYYNYQDHTQNAQIGQNYSAVIKVENIRCGSDLAPLVHVVAAAKAS